MPKRIGLQSIFILGSGPIFTGQAAEFYYSGTQAVRALREEGYVEWTTRLAACYGEK